MNIYIVLREIDSLTLVAPYSSLKKALDSLNFYLEYTEFKSLIKLGKNENTFAFGTEVDGTKFDIRIVKTRLR